MTKSKLFNLAIISLLVLTFTSCKFIFGDKEKGSGDEVEKQIEVPSSIQPERVSEPLIVNKSYLENKPATYINDPVHYEYEGDGTTFVTGDTVTSGLSYKDKAILTVAAKGNGLEITKYHDPIWWYVDIYIYNETRNILNARIVTTEAENKNAKADTYFYPFVAAGEEYKIYIIKQDKNYQNWTSFEYDAVYVTALGGLGNYNISKKAYDYNKATTTITFKDFVLTLPEAVKNNGKITGGVYGGPLWNDDSVWKEGYKFHDSALNLSDVSDVKRFISGKNKLSVTLRYSYSYYDENYKKNFNYECTFIEDTIYDSETDISKTIYLEGEKTIPNVYISSSNCWYSGYTYHFSDDWREASLRIESDDFTFPVTQIQIKDRGNSTKWTDKTPYSIKLPEKKAVLGMKKSKRWVLMANYYDRSLIRTDLAGYIGNNVFNSYWNASFTPVNLYVNDCYVGTYDWGECNKIAKQRVDVQSLEDFADGAEDFVDINNDGSVDINDAGFIVEIDTAINWGRTISESNYKTTVGYDGNAAERIYFYSSEYGIPFTLKEPDFGDWNKYSDSKCKTYGKYAKGKIDAFEKMLKKKSFKYHYTEYIEPISFIDWYLINEFAKNSDANFQKSVPVTYNPETGLLYMGPNWDFDLGFGNFNHSYDIIGGGYSTVDNPTGWYIHNGMKGCDENDLYTQLHGYTVQCWWINRLFEAKSFKKAVKARWNDRKLYLLNAINEQITSYANEIYDYIPANEDHLPRLGQDSWNGPSGYATRTTYEDEIYYLYSWCLARYKWMDAEINKW